MQECVDFLGTLLPALDQAVAADKAGAATEPTAEQAAAAPAAARG
jgi:hypothetical protein